MDFKILLSYFAVFLIYLLKFYLMKILYNVVILLCGECGNSRSSSDIKTVAGYFIYFVTLTPNRPDSYLPGARLGQRSLLSWLTEDAASPISTFLFQQ